jgi:hypothetical protein
MGLSPVQAAEQEERRRMVGQLYIGGVAKGEISETLGCSRQTITRDIKWLEKLWVRELIKDPVEHQARTLATLDKLEREAAERYRSTQSPYWWDRWLKAVLSTSKFLGLDAPGKLDAKLDAEDVHFTIEFETPDGRVVDAETWQMLELEEDAE